MKKILLFISSLILTISSFAQGSVLGIKFGETYSSVLESLNNRYGKYNVHEENGNLTVYDVSIGDYTFHSGDFDFQYTKYNSYFYYANFQRHYGVNESSKAKDYRESIKSTLEKKYEYSEWSNKQGYKCYSFFDALNGKFVCSLTCEKAISNGNKYYIYVMLTYGPFHFVDETSDF